MALYPVSDVFVHVKCAIGSPFPQQPWFPRIRRKYQHSDFTPPMRSCLYLCSIPAEHYQLRCIVFSLCIWCVRAKCVCRTHFFLLYCYSLQFNVSQLRCFYELKYSPLFVFLCFIPSECRNLRLWSEHPFCWRPAVRLLSLRQRGM